MSKVASTETRNVSEASRAWRRDMEQWRSTLQRSLSEAVTEVRELAEAIEAYVQQEAVSHKGQNTATAPVPSPVAAPVNVSAPRTPIGTRMPTNTTMPDRNSASLDSDNLKAASQTPDAGAKPGTSEDRLAELARRLEEKLGRSYSRTGDGRLQQH